MNQLHILDAKRKRIGRLSSEVAKLLRGKDRPDFDPARTPMRQVVIINADSLSVPERKLMKAYYRHSGYPGHLKTRRLKERFPSDSVGLLREAVSGMLPRNRLKKRLLRRLIIHRGAMPHG